MFDVPYNKAVFCARKEGILDLILVPTFYHFDNMSALQFGKFISTIDFSNSENEFSGYDFDTVSASQIGKFDSTIHFWHSRNEFSGYYSVVVDKFQQNIFKIKSNFWKHEIEIFVHTCLINKIVFAFAAYSFTVVLQQLWPNLRHRLPLEKEQFGEK